MSRFLVSSWFKSESKTFSAEMFMSSPSVMKNWLNCFDSRAHSALCKVSKQFQLHSKVFLIYLSYNDSVIHSAFNWWSRIISWGVFLLNEPKIPVQGELALPTMAPHCTIWRDWWRTSAALEAHNSCVLDNVKVTWHPLISHTQWKLNKIFHSLCRGFSFSKFKGRKIQLGDHNCLISGHSFPSLLSAEWGRPEHGATLI